MKTDIRKKVGKIESEIQELNEKRIAVMIKEAGAALEKLLKEHDAQEVRLVKNPHESEIIEFEAAPGIRFMQAGRTFRFTRFGLVNKIMQAKVQEIIASGDDEYFTPESDWTPLYMLKKDEDVDRSTLHLDETVEWLANDEYAWENNIHIPDMFDDNDCDPFDMPYETPSVADCAVADTEESVEETAGGEMDAGALLEAMNKLSAQKKPMNKKALECLKSEYNEYFEAVKTVSEPIEQISLLAGFIKKILESQGVQEVVLASPFGPDFEWEEYETGKNYDDETMADCIRAYLEQNEDFSWFEPNWLAYDETFGDLECLTIYNQLDMTIIVRLGIVDGEVKFTKQDHLQAEIDDMPGTPDMSNGPELCPESDWLKLANIPQPNKWNIIVHALLNKCEIWEYSEKYPQLHKLG